MSDSTHSESQSAPSEALTARRRFLRLVSGVSAALGAVLVGVPLTRSIATPVLAKSPKDNWIKVADDIALLDIGVPIRRDFTITMQDAWVESRAMNGVWLYTEDGEKFKAYNAHCTHLGCGYVYDPTEKIFFCPCHRGQFEIKTGKVLGGPPPRRLDELEVEVRDSAVYVKYKDFRLGVEARIEA
ncbi:ubiquinol-cytochrome c reductase iron-sulfur subunit [bacterium]|nr:ubiquinol-cytochrome c reductase iron-sulfur subunit [bacterium]